jgi:hypothetical protein
MRNNLKFKIRDLNSLTDAYSYNSSAYTLKITYDDEDDKCIEIENILNENINTIEDKINSYKQNLVKTVAKINKKNLSKLNFMDLAEVEEIIGNMKYYIREYHGLKGDL